MRKLWNLLRQAWPTPTKNASPRVRFPLDAYWAAVCANDTPALLIRVEPFEVLRVSDEAQRIFGWTTAAGVTATLQSGLSPSGLEAISFATRGKSILRQLPMRVAGVTSLTLRVTIVPLPEVAGACATMLVSDMSRRTLSTEQAVQGFMELLPHPAWILNHDGFPIFANPHADEFPLEVGCLAAARAETPLATSDVTLEQAIGLLTSAPRLAQSTGQLVNNFIQLGPSGDWRVLHMPVGDWVEQGTVGVVAIRYLSRLAQPNGSHGVDTPAALSAAREEERVAIARDLHDSLGQELTGLKISVWDLTQRCVQNPYRLSIVDELRKLKEHVDRIASQARRLAYELRQEELSTDGLSLKAHQLLQDVHQRTGLRVQLELSPGWKDPSQHLALNMYRGLQELLNNIIKHAKAARCLVRLQSEGGSYVLQVIDDGQGIPLGALEHGGIGFRSIKERAALFSGSVKVATRPEMPGTSVTIIMTEVSAEIEEDEHAGIDS